MANLNAILNIQNLTPVNGQFVFTTQFVNATTGALISDPKFPQNQVFTFPTPITSPISLPVEVGDGDYNVNNIILRVKYKNQTIDVLLDESVDCLSDCQGLPFSLTQIPPSTLSVHLKGAYSEMYNWKILNSNSGVVNTGTVQPSTNNFNLETGLMPVGNYILEVQGVSCKGFSSHLFRVVSNLQPCEKGPFLEQILSSGLTSLQFLFDGNGVFGIKWRIKQGVNVVRSGVIKHTSVTQPGDVTYSNATPTITYDTLAIGNYTLEIEGETCSSDVDVLPFTISNQIVFAFANNTPSVTPVGSLFNLNLAVNQGGTYQSTILNLTTGLYYEDGSINYVSNVTRTVTGLPPGQYYIKIGSLERTIVITEAGGGGVSPCEEGPNVLNISNITKTSLIFEFHGKSVTSIYWKIKQGTTYLRESIVNPTSSIVSITFSELPIGNYVLEIQGSSCSSYPSTRAFSIVDSGIPEPPIVTGPITPKQERFSPPEHINIQIGGSSKNWNISDVSLESAQSPNFGYLYFIDGIMYRQAGKLTNFHWPSNRPLRILKFMPRNDMVKLSELGGGGTDKIQGFSKNATSAYSLIYFNAF